MRSFRKVLALGPWLVLLAGCGPVSDSERAYFEARANQQEQSEMLRALINSRQTDADVLQMVKAAPVKEGEGNMEEWVGQQMTFVVGQVLFPRWEVQRRGVSTYEVRYTYTHIDASNQLYRSGFKWDADPLVKVISAPSVIKPTAVDARNRAGNLDERRVRRIAEHEASLE